MRGRQRGCGRGIIPARAGFTRGRRRPSNSPPDHPRSRGVYGHRRAHRILCAGSSPLARGLRMGGGALGPAPRIIPARAGFTARVTCAPASARDHPRSRGVYMPSRAGSVSCLGSSPLARGLRSRDDWIETILVDHPRSRGVYPRQFRRKIYQAGSSPLARGLHRVQSDSSQVEGIIPARAGFTADELMVGEHGLDHPRSRGVYATPHGETLTEARIIPARAGFTPGSPSGSPARPDHPRSRGVYWSAGTSSGTPEGSSPLARGLHGGAPHAVEGGGIIPARAGFTGGHDLRRDGCWIIPARAGFTCSTRRRPCSRRDHPRSRGVYCGPRPWAPHAAGSSPLARGLLAGHPDERAALRIIPARAGFTRHRSRARDRAQDHPRSRGVYMRFHLRSSGAFGSSPLARGLRWSGHSGPAEERIIPARAGFTRALYQRLPRVEDHPRSRGVYRPWRRPPAHPGGSSPLARGLLVPAQ